MEEKIDILYENGRPQGYAAGKIEAHRKGLWHATAHVWLYNPCGEVLLQKRSENKDTFPGLWDISAAGHIETGESPVEGALRELLEELGVEACENGLEYIGTKKVNYTYKNRINREICYIYLLEISVKTEELRLQREEVSDAKYYSLPDFLGLSLPEREFMVPPVSPNEDYYSFIARLIQERTQKP